MAGEYIVEIVRHGKYDRDKLRRFNSWFEIDRWGQMDAEEYSSVYYYPPEAFNYMLDHGGKLKGYDGDVASVYLHWDVDNGSLEESLRVTREIYRRLVVDQNAPKENIKVFSSGAKGFHIIYLSKGVNDRGMYKRLPYVVRTVCEKIAQGLGIDNAVYNRGRIFRTINSWHMSTGQFKVDVTDILVSNLLPEETLSQIEVRGSAPYQTVWSNVQNVESPLIMNMLVEAEDEAEANKVMSSAPSIKEQDILKMITHGTTEGSRNEALTRLAGRYHAKGISDSEVSAILHMVNRQSQNPLPESEVDTVAKSVCSYAVSFGEVKTVSINNVHTIRTAGKSWYDLFALTGFVSFGPKYTHFTREMEVSVPGDVIGIVANSGVGKTQLAIDLVNEMAIAMNGRFLMITIEMNIQGIFFRAAITESWDIVDEKGNVPAKAVARNLHDPDTGLMERVYQRYERLLMVDEATGVGQIRDYALMVKQELDKYKIPLVGVVIDYGQMIDGTDENGKQAAVARGIKTIAKTLKVRVFLLLQLNKTLVKKFEEPNRSHIEGTGAWFQSMDYMFMTWLCKESTGILLAKCEKNRFGLVGSRFALEKTGMDLQSIDWIPDPVQRNGE